MLPTPPELVQNDCLYVKTKLIEFFPVIMEPCLRLIRRYSIRKEKIAAASGSNFQRADKDVNDHTVGELFCFKKQGKCIAAVPVKVVRRAFEKPG